MKEVATRPQDTWASGEAYELYVGRWSRLVAREFLRWLVVPAGSRWRDIGCGTGALTRTILQEANPSKVKGTDRSPDFIENARRHVQDPRAEFEVGEAHTLPDDTASYDVAVSGLLLNFLPQPDRAVSEMRRIVRPGGIVAGYVWDYAGKMEMMRHFWDAAASLDPGARELDEGPRFPLCRPEPLARLFEEAGLKNVAVRAIEIPTVFRDFDDYWSPFLGGQGPAPSYAVSLEEAKLTALREKIRAGLPIGADGSIDLVAQAWAVRGARR